MESKLKKLIIGLLVSLFGVSSGAKEVDWKTSPIEAKVGIHLLSNYGSKHDFLNTTISSTIIAEELLKLDWKNNFYQFVVVSEPGISMEVGGSLNGIDGLSAMYTDRHQRIQGVIKQPPESVKEMQNILNSFLQPNRIWIQQYDFSYTKY
jgi:hypothetical protein